MAGSDHIFPTRHAVQKMQDRDISWAEVVEIVDNPDVIYGPDYRGRRVIQKDDVAVVLGPNGGVITVLFRNEEQWTDEQVRSRKSKLTWRNTP